MLSFAHVDLAAEFAADGTPLVWFNGEEAQSVDGVGPAEGTDGFRYPHDPNWTPDGTLMVSTRTPEQESIVAEYAVEGNTYTEVWAWGRGRDEDAEWLGQGRRLPGGTTLVNTGSEGILREVDAEGEILWEAVAPSEFAWATAQISD
jgi:hypothetical protein